MGSATQISWSHTGQQLFEMCPRAYFWEYFPWDEPELQAARFLRRAITPEAMAGLAVDWTITATLRKFRQGGIQIVNLQKLGLSWFDKQVALAESIGRDFHLGRKPPLEGPVFHHDLYIGEDPDRIERARDHVCRCLVKFETSHLWAFLTGTKTRKWRPLDEDARDKRWFDVDGLRAYAKYDFALAHEHHFYILDWKTGEATPAAREAAARQLSAYALRAREFRRYKTSWARVRVQAVWLREDIDWLPEEVDEEAVSKVLSDIRAHRAMLDKVVEVVISGKGREAKTKFVTSRESFPARPQNHTCCECKFLAICDVGINLK